MTFFIHPEDRFGHHFSRGRILIITMPDAEALSLLQAQKGRTSVLFRTKIDVPVPFVPEEICLRSEETWYAVRFHDFQREGRQVSFVIHFLKALYMASADLLAYRKKALLLDAQGREWRFFSDKVDQTGENAENGTGDDIIGIMNAADDANEGFGEAGQKQQHADAFVDLQHGHGDDHA